MALTHHQSYLLRRLPGRYLPTLPSEPEPAKVQAARKIVQAWEEKKKAKRVEEEKKWNAMLGAVREAIYFKPPEDALKAVKELEATLAK